MEKDQPGSKKQREAHKWGEKDRKRKKGVCLVWRRHEKGGEREEESRAGFERVFLCFLFLLPRSGDTSILLEFAPYSEPSDK